MTEMTKTKKKFKKTLRAAAPPSKYFTAHTPKLGEYVYKHGTSKTTARNIKVTEALSNHVGMMTSVTACFGTASMISLIKPDLEELSVPVK